MESILKKMGWTSMLESILFFIIGIVLICKPDGTINLISKILGIMFTIIGIMNVINFIKTKDNVILMCAIMFIVMGIVAFFYMNVINAIFRIIIGAWIIYTGIIRLMTSFDLKKIDSRLGICGIVLAVIMLCCGIYTILNANAIVVTIGVIMVIYSIIDLVENIIFTKNIKNMM